MLLAGRQHLSISCTLQSSSASGTPARVAPPSPFGARRGVPRAHSAFVPTRSYAPSDSSLMSAESAPAMAQGVDLRGSGAPGDGDVQGTESPKKAGRLQHLKMRVAVRFRSLSPATGSPLLDPAAACFPPPFPDPLCRDSSVDHTLLSVCHVVQSFHPSAALILSCTDLL